MNHRNESSLQLIIIMDHHIAPSWWIIIKSSSSNHHQIIVVVVVVLAAAVAAVTVILILILILTITLALGCSLCPIQWARQHQATSNNGPSCIPVLLVNTKQVTFTEIIVHTSRPLLSRPTSPFGVRNHYVCDWFFTGCGMLYMYRPPESLTAEDCHNILNGRTLE